MSTDLPVLWSPAQQAWLQAMGYTVYHDSALAPEMAAALQVSVARETEQALTTGVAAVAQARSEAPAAAAPERARADDRPVPRSAAPQAPPAVQPTQAVARRAVGNGGRQPSVRLPDRLQMALLRASGCNPNDPATRALMESWPLDTLRGNAAAKRALWPTLRALRRKGAAP